MDIGYALYRCDCTEKILLHFLAFNSRIKQFFNINESNKIRIRNYKSRT